jgi:pimeloyl-ACP methyl ester carboxylesterase
MDGAFFNSYELKKFLFYGTGHRKRSLILLHSWNFNGNFFYRSLYQFCTHVALFHHHNFYFCVYFQPGNDFTIVG